MVDKIKEWNYIGWNRSRNGTIKNIYFFADEIFLKWSPEHFLKYV